MVDVAQLVRASDCGSEGRGFEPHLPPKILNALGHFYFKMNINKKVEFTNSTVFITFTK